MSLRGTKTTLRNCRDISRSTCGKGVNTGRKDHCRLWAQAIHTERPDLDGLWHHSSMTGGTLITLFTHAADSFPERPGFDMPLAHPGLHLPLLDACRSIGYRLV